MKETSILVFVLCKVEVFERKKLHGTRDVMEHNPGMSSMLTLFCRKSKI